MIKLEINVKRKNFDFFIFISAKNMNLLILSTIPHFYTLHYITNDKIYFTIVLFSSSFSILWHYLCEPKNFIFFIDYTLGLLWTLYEIYKFRNEYILQVIFMNLFVLFTNILTDEISKKKILEYKYSHSIFHIVSSIKTIYIAFLFSE